MKDVNKLTEYLTGKRSHSVSGHRGDPVSTGLKRIFNGKLLVLMSCGFILLTSMLHYRCSPDSRNRPESRDHLRPLDDVRNLPTKDNSIDWFKAGTSDKINGVALVIHGLNLRPVKMESIITMLTDSGIDVLNLSLGGHGRNYSHEVDVDSSKARIEAFKAVSYKLWMDEAHRAYRCARKRSDEKKTALFFIGFSLGGLIGADLFASHPDVRFDKMVLLAPALDIHTIHYVAKLLSPFPGLVMPSLTSKSYLANNGTPMAAYNALFETIKHFNQHVGPKLNVPTIIFIDPQDELVSYRKLKRRVEKETLDQWQFHLLEKGKTGVQEKMHHLIIDEPSVGTDTWKQMKIIMIEHLLS
jgi:esterase/lipase